MIYGKPALRIDHDQTDRIGLRTLGVSLLWQPSRWPMTIDEYDEETPATPAMPGGLILMGAGNIQAGGAMRRGWSFMGVKGDGKSVTFKDRNNSLDFQFDPGFSTISLKLHPDFRKFQELYGVFVDTDGSIFCPIDMPDSSGGSGFAKSTQGSKKDNPLFGVEDFPEVEGTYSFRYLAFSTDAAQNGVGKIHTTGSLPGRPPRTEDGRNWLKAPSPFRCLGAVFEITEIYWLSYRGGWREPLFGGLKGSPFNSGLQPSTGGLGTTSLEPS